MKKTISIFLIAILTFSIVAHFDFSKNQPTEPFVETKADDSYLPKIRYYYREGTDTVNMTADEEIFESAMEPTDTVEVVFEMEYAPPSCNCKQLITLDSTEEEVDLIKARHREEMKAFYSEKNQDFLENNESLFSAENCEITASQYSPFIQMVFDDYADYQSHSDAVVTLANDNDISGINIGIPIEYEEAATTVDTADANIYPLSDAIEDIDAESQTYNGTGVKVGIIEAKGVTVSSDHPDLYDLTIYTGGSNTYSDHAELVTRIFCGSQGVARNVDAAYIYHAPTDSSMIGALDWMVANDVDVINQSLNPENFFGTYHWSSSLLDTYIYNHFLNIVNSAGNNGNATNPNVGAFAMGYNVIAVGNLDYFGRVNTDSAYGANNGIHTRKPTLSAPGTEIHLGDIYDTGTSYSAPMVAGVIAKLIDEKPGLAGFPEIVMVSLIASATPVAGQGNDWDTHAGAGRVNYQKAREAVKNATRIINDSDNIGELVNRQITLEPGRRIKVVAFWFAKPSTYTANSPVTPNTHTDYDLKITTSGGSYITRSAGITNIEYINYNNTSNSTLKIVLNQYSNQVVNDCWDYGGITWCYE